MQPTYPNLETFSMNKNGETVRLYDQSGDVKSCTLSIPSPGFLVAQLDATDGGGRFVPATVMQPGLILNVLCKNWCWSPSRKALCAAVWWSAPQHCGGIDPQADKCELTSTWDGVRVGHLHLSTCLLYYYDRTKMWLSYRKGCDLTQVLVTWRTSRSRRRYESLSDFVS